MLFNEVVSAKSVSNRAQKGAFFAGKVACAATKVAAIEVAKASMKVALKAAKGEDACATRIASLDAEYAEMKGAKKAEKKDSSQKKEVKEEKKEAVKEEQPKEIKEEKRAEVKVSAPAVKEAPVVKEAQEVSEKKGVKSAEKEAYEKRFLARQEIRRDLRAVKAHLKEVVADYKETAAADDGSEEDGEYILDLDAQVTTILGEVNDLRAKLGKEPISLDEAMGAVKTDAEKADELKEEQKKADKRFRKVLVKRGMDEKEAAAFPRFTYHPEDDYAGYPTMYYLVATEGKGEQEALMDYIMTVLRQYTAFLTEVEAASLYYVVGGNLKGGARYMYVALDGAEDAADYLVDEYEDPWAEKALEQVQKAQQHMRSYVKELA